MKLAITCITKGMSVFGCGPSLLFVASIKPEFRFFASSFGILQYVRSAKFVRSSAKLSQHDVMSILHDQRNSDEAEFLDSSSWECCTRAGKSPESRKTTNLSGVA